MTQPPVEETDVSAEKPVKSDKTPTVWSVLRNPLFLCVGVSQAVANIGMSIMFTYLPDVTVLRGFPKAKSNLLLSIVAITNTLGRIVVGLITDLPWVDSLMTSNTCILLLGLATLFVPFFSSYSGLVVMALLFGFGAAGMISMGSIVMVDVMGLKSLNVSFGCLAFFKGFGILVGAPIGGLMFDATNSYDHTFYFGGGVSTFASLIGFTLQFVRWKKSRGEVDKQSKPVTQETNLEVDMTKAEPMQSP